MKVAITGATGFVGTRLVEQLQAANDSILVLTRDLAKGQRVFPASAFPKVEILAYTPQTSGDWQKAIATCDAVVNLAGVPIADERWTSDRKREILDSRQITTQKLVEAIAQADRKPQVLINASAIGYYGTSETAIFDETSPTGDDFLATVCQAWETEAQKVKDLGVRLVILRLGIVLGEGGVLAKMLPPFKLFAGGPLGRGQQWFSWIHRDDLVNLILLGLRQQNVQGVLNATAPNPVRMSELCNTLGQVLNRPSWLPVPELVLDVLLGDAAKLVLEGQQVLPNRPLEYGFKYQYPTIQEALTEILK